MSSTDDYFPKKGFRYAILTIAGVFLPLVALLGFLSGRRRLGLLAFLSSNALILYPTLKRNTQIWGPVVRGFKTTRKEVWLTLDDGPDPYFTPKALALLRRYDAKASFFCIGNKVASTPEISRSIVSEGHSIENHTQDHLQSVFWALPPSPLRRQVRQAVHSIRAATGVSPIYFRSPVGMTNPFVHSILKEEGLRLVGWSSAGFDGVNRPSRAVLRCILPNIEPGAIVLLHEGTGEASSLERLHTLELLLLYLRANDYTCVIPTPESLLQ